MGTTTRDRLATDAQVGYIESLLERKVVSDDLRGAIDIDELTKRQASAVISALKACPWKPREGAPAQAAPAAPAAPTAAAAAFAERYSTGQALVTVTEGASGEHLVFKIAAWRGPKGEKPTIDDPVRRYYVRIQDEAAEWGWGKLGYLEPADLRLVADRYSADYGPRVAAALEALVADDQSAHRIQIEARCAVCGAELTDPVSIERGIGPTCFGRVTKSRAMRKEPVAS